MSNILEVKKLLDFKHAVSNENIINITTDSQGNPIILTNTEEDEYYYYNIHYYIKNTYFSIHLPKTTNIYKYVQPLGEHWLLIEPRVKDNLDKNAHIYSSSGGELNSFHIGDGIKDVQTTADEHIWVSYFDEGIVGDTIAANGVNCFNREGHTRFSFHTQYHDLIVEGQLSAIDDCYAINVTSNEDVFVYYYGHFPLVHIKNRSELSLWENVEMEGSHAFAVHNEFVLFDSEFNSSNEVYLFNLNSKELKEYLLNFEGEFFQFDYAFARQNKMYFKKDTALYVLHLSS
ncbi:MAG: hypothetical protein ACI35O_14940 [Bacillaceae bacterium]